MRVCVCVCTHLPDNIREMKREEGNSKWDRERKGEGVGAERDRERVHKLVHTDHAEKPRGKRGRCSFFTEPRF